MMSLIAASTRWAAHISMVALAAPIRCICAACVGPATKNGAASDPSLNGWVKRLRFAPEA
jgi:hypothetical protein